MTERLARALIMLELIRTQGKIPRLQPVGPEIQEAYAVTLRSYEEEVEMIRACEAADARTRAR